MQLLKLSAAATIATTALMLSCNANPSEAAATERTPTALVQANIRPNAAAVQDVAQIDFAPQLAKWKKYTLRDDLNAAPGSVRSLLSSQQGEVGNSIPARDLTEKELAALGVWELPGTGAKRHWRTVLDALYDYHKIHGDLPSSGRQLLEVLAEKGATLPPQGSSDADLAVWAFPAINKITGRLYDSFTSREWSPGGLQVKVITDELEIERTYPQLRLHDAQSDGLYRATQVWQVTMYGEAPGSKLFEGEFYY